ncbi:Coatomer subunit delta [Geodia barretti]|uniref:Coatomer subunit delta n=1 Tax=Geodia barretti TaxID=519541 RepID=A0AA35TFT7_GEOBA|nr:Coatomer subunit delta [Geodia barretti]
MSASHQSSKPAYNPPSRPQRAGGGSALKLKKKDKDVDMFVDKLVQEGERVTSVTAPRQPSMTAKTTTSTPHASVHLKVTERLSLVAGREGGLQSMEILGMIMLRITDQEFSKIRVLMDNKDQRGLQFQDSFESALQLEPTNTTLKNNIAVCTFYQGYLKECIRELEGVVRWSPPSSLQPALLTNLTATYDLESSSAHSKKLSFLPLLGQHVGEGFPLSSLGLR